jgi:hypothetical protein
VTHVSCCQTAIDRRNCAPQDGFTVFLNCRAANGIVEPGIERELNCRNRMELANGIVGAVIELANGMARVENVSRKELPIVSE